MVKKMSLFGKKDETGQNLDVLSLSRSIKRLEMKLINLQRKMDKIDNRVETIAEDIYDPDDNYDDEESSGEDN